MIRSTHATRLATEPSLRSTAQTSTELAGGEPVVLAGLEPA
jgi:hypothetical protein